MMRVLFIIVAFLAFILSSVNAVAQLKDVEQDGQQGVETGGVAIADWPNVLQELVAQYDGVVVDLTKPETLLLVTEDVEALALYFADEEVVGFTAMDQNIQAPVAAFITETFPTIEPEIRAKFSQGFSLSGQDDGQGGYVVTAQIFKAALPEAETILPPLNIGNGNQVTLPQGTQLLSAQKNDRVEALQQTFVYDTPLNPNDTLTYFKGELSKFGLPTQIVDGQDQKILRAVEASRQIMVIAEPQEGVASRSILSVNLFFMK